MHTSLNLSSTVAKISRFGMAGLSIAIVGIVFLGISSPAYADDTIYTFVTVGAYENTGTQYGTLSGTIPLGTLDSGVSVVINSITPEGFTLISGEAADEATNLQFISLASNTLVDGDSDTLYFSWDPVDRTPDSDVDFGLWQGSFLVDYTVYSGGVAVVEETVPVAFDAQVNDTPEPGSFYLFGSGLLALAGVLRRKFLHS